MTANSTTTVKNNVKLVDDSKAYQADDDHRAAYMEIVAIDAQIAALKAARAELVKPIRKDMETLEVSKIVDVDDSTMFTLTTSTPTTFKAAKFKEDYPALYNKYYTQDKERVTFKVY